MVSSEGQGKEKERCMKSCCGQHTLFSEWWDALLRCQVLFSLVPCQGTRPRTSVKQTVAHSRLQAGQKFGRKLCRLGGAERVLKSKI